MHWKTLKVPHKTVKWLDKRYPFGQRVFGFEIKPSFCVGRLKMCATNTIFYGCDSEILLFYDSLVSSNKKPFLRRCLFSSEGKFP